MFYSKATEYYYECLTEIKDYETLYFPVDVDTEYTHPEYDLNNPSKTICKNLTVQCRSRFKPTGIIYDHPDNSTSARHKVYTHDFVVCDYLEDLGYQVNLTRLPSWETPTDIPYIQFDIYAYYAVAELFRMVKGGFKKDIKQLCHENSSTGIEQGRRLRTYTKQGNKLLNTVVLPWVLKINDYDYRVRLAIYDTSAVHGNANYASFCSNSGITLKYKEEFNTTEKRRMDIMYSKRPDDFDNYALGDLFNHDALLGNAENFSVIYETLGLEKFYSLPKLTIGATVARLFGASINNLFHQSVDVPEDYINGKTNVINKFCKYGTADWLKRKTTTTACLNAKVDGGRCRNNRPTETLAKGVLCDIDISGCYGEGLRVQTYPLGRPVLIDYPTNSDINEYLTLRQFLKRYGKELVPGLWQARVSLTDGYTLAYKQDYLASWFPPKDISRMVTDSEMAETDLWWTVDNVGEIKILNNEIHHAVITHDFIQWLENVASARQRKELLDNLIVETALYYPASERVESIAQLTCAYQNHKGKNKTFANNSKLGVQKVAIEQECHKWFGINLGALLVDQLLIERKKHPKKTSFNELYKLCINTVYGDMVSPFFTIGNVVVGNNITARARALAWCMEKGLHGWQSITDGCVFDLNRVLYPNRHDRRISGELVVNLYAENDYKSHTFKPLAEVNDLTVTLKSIDISLGVVDGSPQLTIVKEDEETYLSPSESLTWVNKVAMKHLQRLFPNLDILHKASVDVYGTQRLGQYEFEVKSFYDTACFHGTANYSLSFNGTTTCKMRSYSKKEHRVYELVNDKLVLLSNNVKPSETFLDALASPNAVARSKVFIRERILKVGDYRRNYKSWMDTDVYPGCTVETPSLIHEFSLSQFTFKTKKQYDSWRSEYQSLVNKYGQSFEMFFINDNGTLNYQLMIETVDAAIRAGKMSLFEGIDKRQTHFYRRYDQHVEQFCFQRTREQLSKRYYASTDVLDSERFSEDFLDV